MKLKLQKDIRERVVKVRNTRLKHATKETMFEYVNEYPRLVTLNLEKTVLEPFIEVVKFITVFIFLLLFQPVFVPFVFIFIPVGLIYNKYSTEPINTVPKVSSYNLGKSVFENDRAIENIQTDFQRDWLNRKGDIYPSQSLRGAITLFRVLFLGFFGYILIQQSIQLENLVVGLLFITIMARSILRIIENKKFIHITRSAVKKCYNIYKA